MTLRERLGLPDLGVGLGLRVPHYSHVLEAHPAVDFFEVISDNYMVPGGKPRYHLAKVLERYAVVQHGVSLGIGNPEPPDLDYLRALRALVRETRTPWVSDHFCWCGADGAHLHDLLPLPYTRENAARIAERARRVQDYLEVPLLLENTSSYLGYRASTLSEWDFIGEVADRADIGLLFDVNNVWVTAFNHGLDPVAFLEGVPHDRVVQVHLAGHTHHGRYIIDTHGAPVIEPVMDLYRLLVERAGSVSTVVEWDEAVPAFPVVAAEAERARTQRTLALEARNAGQSSVDTERLRSALRRARAARPS